jgi:hypothetical protein
MAIERKLPELSRRNDVVKVLNALILMLFLVFKNLKQHQNKYAKSSFCYCYPYNA